MSNFPSTPHINIQNEIGFGKTVLMPGDPLRAKFIAENFLENPVLVNNVRGVNGYTGCLALFPPVGGQNGAKGHAKQQRGKRNAEPGGNGGRCVGAALSRSQGAGTQHTK